MRLDVHHHNVCTGRERHILQEIHLFPPGHHTKHAFHSLLCSTSFSQTVLRESRELHGDLESMAEKVELLSEVLQVESMSQQVCELSRTTEELQQNIKTRLQSLEDGDKVEKEKMYFVLLVCNFTFLHLSNRTFLRTVA